MPTAHRIMKVLEQREYLVQDVQTRLYALGPAILRLAQVVTQRSSQHVLIKLVLPHLERLRDTTGETALLHCPVRMNRMCVAEVPSRQPLGMAYGLGTTLPLHLGAAGKVILAWSNATTVERAVAASSAAGESWDGAGLRRELKRIRRTGYAISPGDGESSASSVAVPVFSSSGTIAGAISVTGPRDRWDRRAILQHVPLVVGAGVTTSAALGYAGCGSGSDRK